MLVKTFAVVIALVIMVVASSLAMTTPLNLDSLSQGNPDLQWLNDPISTSDQVDVSVTDDPFSFGTFPDDGFITGQVTINSDSYYSYGPTTKLQITKSATGFSERSVSYDWSVAKTASPAQLTLKKGGPAGAVDFTIVATRTKTSDTVTFGVYGNVCVTNTGNSDTRNLRIVDKVQFRSSSYLDSNPSLNYYPYTSVNFIDISGSAHLIDTSSNPVLSPGEKGCYTYTTRFTLPQGSDYYSNVVFRNVAMATITNYQDHNGYRYGPLPVATSFAVPSTPTSVKYYDEHAKLYDIESCPQGFSCYLQNKGQGVGPWLLIGTDDSAYSDANSSETITLSYSAGPVQESASVKFGERLQNNNASCNITVPLTDRATLIEIDSGQRHSALATSNLWTGPCSWHY